MTFNRWVHNHTRSILFVITVLALGGAISGWVLPVSLFPRVSFPRIRATLDSGDRPAQQMAVAVTYPVEQSVRAIPGVVSVRSTTSRGSADISIDFGWGRNMAQALLQVQLQINRVLPRLPAGTTFRAKRLDTTNFPVLGYSLTSRTLSLVQLRNIAEYQLRPLISTVRGVARIQVQGGAVAEYRVQVNPVRMQSLGLTLADVARALSSANVLTSVGRLEDHDKLYLVVSDTRFTSLQQIRRTILRSGSHGIVRLEDVARVELSTQPQWTRVTADGRDAVLLQVFQQPGGNTVQIARDVKQKLTAIEDALPAGVVIATWYNQSQLILAAAKSVRDAVIIGVILAVFVLLLFLRNWKITLIAALTVPAVLAAATLLLYLLHMSFNIMTLGGMAAAVGLIIDDAIVMVEHIVRRLATSDGDSRARVILAVNEFTRPLAGSSASTVIIFAPLAFLSGVTGAFFKALSVTMAASLFISFFVVWLGVPVLAVALLRESDLHEQHGGWITRQLHRLYQGFMQKLLPSPWMVLLVIAGVLGVGYYAYGQVGSGFMPKMDEGGFILDYVAPPGTSLAETNRMLKQVEAILRQDPAVDTYSRRTGLQLGGGLTESYTGDFFVRLKSFPRPPIGVIMADIRRRVHATVPALKIDTAQLMQDLIGDLTAVPQPIEIKIFSDNTRLLDATARRVEAAIKTVPGVVEARSGIVLSGDAIDIKIDRVKAALEGMDADSITRLISAYLTGVVTTHIQKGPQILAVRVWVPHANRTTIGGISRLMIQAPDGHQFALGQVVHIRTVSGQQEITRDNLKRMVAVNARISGRDMGSTVADVQRVLQKPGLFPKGIYYTLGGLYHQQQIAFRGLLVVMIAAVLLVFLLLLFLYESFRVAGAMLAIPLLALATVFVGLWFTGTELNISSMMGMTMVVGIVTEVAIFYYSEYRELPAETGDIQRLIDAGKNRLRPIAMTSLAAILALLPLALGSGQGAQMQRPLAVAIISGLTVQLPLTLVVLPALLAIGRRPKPVP